MGLRARDITVRRSKKELIRSMNVDVSPGEIVIILGPNGAGKSTLLSVLSGDNRPTEGEVTLHGKPLAKYSSLDLAKHRAVLPQTSQISFRFPVLDVVLLGRYPHHGGIETRRDRQIAWQLLERVSMAHRASDPYTQLSGGEQLRVQVARVLAQLEDAERGGVLILDEPTASLDLPQAAAVLNLARERAKGGAAVLAVLHDVNLAARFADRLVLLKDGEIVAKGTPLEILTPEMMVKVWDQPCQVLEHPEDAGPLVVPLISPSSSLTPTPLS